ncbi:MAG: cytochrome-c peroxidase [Flavobacteriales bacterium]
MKKYISIFALAALAIAIAQSCSKEAANAGIRIPVLPEQTEAYNELPTGSGIFNPFGNGTVNNEKATLGRVLFYETQLSVNNSTSCGSCHNQKQAFATGNAVDAGFNGGLTTRNVPPITNPGTQTSYFWDMRESNLQAMVTQPIANHIEMGLEEPEYMAAKVRSLTYYKPLFANAYGSEEVTPSKIGEALSHFVRAMISVNSKFDEGNLTNFTNYTEEENQGRQLFMNDLPCAQCHGGENFHGWGSMAMNIGLDEVYSDPGVPGVDWNTGEAMNGWFKVPSLRNVALSAPYMHDGRFSTLEQVVEFYDNGIQPHNQLAFALREGWNGIITFEDDDAPFDPNALNPLRMNLSNTEKKALVAFLKTLTDESTITHQKFSNPFVMIQE